jgi:hypothetical protein
MPGSRTAQRIAYEARPRALGTASTKSKATTTMSPTWPHGLDPESPDDVFVDGEHEYAVRAAPAAFPTLFMFGGGAGGTLSEVIFKFLVVLTSGLIAVRRDSRWKVVVVRAALKKPALWHAIDVEFTEADDAERRQVEILRSWDSRQRADQAVMRLREVRRLRRDTRA